MKHEVKCSSRTSCGPEALLSVLKLPPLEGGRRSHLHCPVSCSQVLLSYTHGSGRGTIFPFAFSTCFPQHKGQHREEGLFVELPGHTQGQLNLILGVET